MNDSPESEAECEEPHLSFDDELWDDGLWDKVSAVTHQMRGSGPLLSANVATALMMIAGMVFGGGLGRNSLGPREAAMIAVASVSTLVSVGIGYFRASRRAFRASDWVRTRRPATPQERGLVLMWPEATAIDVLAAWSLVSLVVSVAAATMGYPPLNSLRIVIIGTLAGCGAAALSFMLLEQLFRPVLQLALAGHAAPGGSKLGLRRRFFLLWALTGAVPLSVLGTIWIGQPAEERALLPVVLAVNAAVAVIWGLGGTYAVSRSVIEPVTALRAAQRRVEDGDLTVQIPVDYGGEVGQLQAGFNHMVAGLREHQRLHDIFGRHVGIEVARAALATGVRLGGERRSASVLFFDLIGSTAMTQRLEPEEVVAVLNDVFGAVVQCVTNEGGWVNKFEGDAALCVFGPPTEHTGHAAAALRAARALRSEFIALAKSHPGLDAAIGVSSGEVIAGNIGAADRYEYTVIGDAVNEAARLTEQAKTVPERLLTSHAAVADAGDESSEWRPHEPMLLRGRSSETETYVPVASATVESPRRQGVPSAHGSP